jgi:hypothetical protein
MGANSGIRSAYPYGSPEFTPMVFSGVPVARSFSFLCNVI